MIDQSARDIEDSATSSMTIDWRLRLHRMKLIALRHWWIPLLTIGAGTGIMAYVGSHEAPRYYSTARMIAASHPSYIQGQVYSENDAETFFGTQLGLMKSSTNINRAIQQLKATHPDITPESDADTLIEADVEQKASIFNLKVTSHNADYSRLLLDALMDTYLAEKRARKDQASDEARAGMTEEITHLDNEIQKDEQALLDFQKVNDMVFIETQSTSSAAHLTELNNELANLLKERDLMALENKDNRLTTAENNGLWLHPSMGSGAINPTISETAKPDETNIKDSDISPTQDNIEQLKILREQLGIFLKDKHPKMIQLADEIDREQKFIGDLKARNLESLGARREDLELQIQNVQKQFEAAEAASVKLSGSLASYQQLKEKLSRDETLYGQLVVNIHNVDLNKSLDQEDVVILEVASQAKQVEDFFNLLGWGSLCGVIAGVIIIYLIVRLDNKVESTLQLTEAFGLPIIGQIPWVRPDRRTNRVSLIEEEDQRHIYVEHLCNLRSAIIFQSFQSAKVRSLMICSAAPGEGKSTLAANLAVVLAHAGLNVLLIDADLRRGSLHSHFGVKASPGLSNYLRNEISLPEAFQATSLPNLVLMPRGESSRWAGDLLLGGAIDLLIKESSMLYDFVLWDSAPLLAAHDAANMCSKVDGVLFLARYRSSSLRSIHSSLEDLLQRKAKVLGFVLNAVKHSELDYYHKYQYKEYYQTEATLSAD